MNFSVAEWLLVTAAQNRVCSRWSDVMFLFLSFLLSCPMKWGSCRSFSDCSFISCHVQIVGSLLLAHCLVLKIRNGIKRLLRASLRSLPLSSYGSAYFFGGYQRSMACCLWSRPFLRLLLLCCSCAGCSSWSSIPLTFPGRHWLCVPSCIHHCTCNFFSYLAHHGRLLFALLRWRLQRQVLDLCQRAIFKTFDFWSPMIKVPKRGLVRVEC